MPKSTSATATLADFLTLQRKMETARARLGRDFRDARTAVGVSQNELADHLGLNQSFISHVESGVSVPSAENMERVVRYLRSRERALKRAQRRAA